MASHRVVATILVSSAEWLGGCAHAPASGPLRIDGSAPTAFHASWERMHRSLTREQQAQLDVAVLPIALGSYKSFTDVPPSLLAGVGPDNIRTQVDGMTFEEILALARSEPVRVGLPGRP